MSVGTQIEEEKKAELELKQKEEKAQLQEE